MSSEISPDDVNKRTGASGRWLVWVTKGLAWLGGSLLALALCAVMAGLMALAIAYPNLPDVSVLSNYAAAIFAPHADACEQLRRALKVTEHFSEHRHETLPSVVTAARAASETAPTPAYNLIETWSVLDRDASPAPAYDAERVTRATEAELPALADLSFEVSQLRRESHRKAFLDEGGTVLVARIDGRIEGAAYLSVVGDRARLWGLAVRVDARGRGLGAELVRAAIAHAAPLGATRIVTEVPPDAIGARALLEAEGFRAKSELHVESAAETRPTRKIPWR